MPGGSYGRRAAHRIGNGFATWSAAARPRSASSASVAPGPAHGEPTHLRLGLVPFRFHRSIVDFISLFATFVFEVWFGGVLRNLQARPSPMHRCVACRLLLACCAPVPHHRTQPTPRCLQRERAVEMYRTVGTHSGHAVCRCDPPRVSLPRIFHNVHTKQGDMMAKSALSLLWSSTKMGFQK